MAHSAGQELIERFEDFYQEYYTEEIKELAQRADSQQSLSVDWADLSEFDDDLAEDYCSQPAQLRDCAKEALCISDIPDEGSLERVPVRIENLPHTISPSDLRSEHAGQLVSVEGVVVEASEVKPKLQEGAFECQRCGTLTRIPLSDEEYQEPHQCEGCERQGPFEVHIGQSEMVDHQKAVLHDLPGETGRRLDHLPAHFRGDIAGTVHEQDRVTVVGEVHLEQDSEGSDRFNTYLEGVSVSTQDPADWDRWTEYLDMERPVSTPSEDDLDAFITRSRQILDAGPALDEWNTQAKIITPFLHVLGWNVYAPEVQLEYPRDDDAIDDRADYVLFREGEPAVVVEAKRAGRLLQAGIKEAKRYMRLIGTEWGIATNGERYVVLRSDPDSDQPAERTILDVTLEELVHSRCQLLPVIRTPSTDDIKRWGCTGRN